MQPMSSPSDISENMPNASMMYSTFTPIFGNLQFQIAPSQTGSVNFNFGSIPYVSLEGLIYMQQLQAPTQPSSIISGQHSGQQNVQGAITVTGAAGNVQVAIGNATAANGGY